MSACSLGDCAKGCEQKKQQGVWKGLSFLLSSSVLPLFLLNFFSVLWVVSILHYLNTWNRLGVHVLVWIISISSMFIFFWGGGGGGEWLDADDPADLMETRLCIGFDPIQAIMITPVIHKCPVSPQKGFHIIISIGWTYLHMFEVIETI